MVKPTLKVIGSGPMFIAMAVWLTFYATVNMWPASFSAQQGGGVRVLGREGGGLLLRGHVDGSLAGLR